MAMLRFSATLLGPRSVLLPPLSSCPPESPIFLSKIMSTVSFPGHNNSCTRSKKAILRSSYAAMKKESFEEIAEGDENEMECNETLLYSFAPFPLLFVAALPGAGTLRSVFGPFVELVKSWNLPGWLVHWGHPGNMAVVLFAMGGYGTYLGFRIRFSNDVEEKAKAKDLHPKLLGGMFFFFALGATGGITALLTSDKPIFERFHWPFSLDHTDYFAYIV